MILTIVILFDFYTCVVILQRTSLTICKKPDLYTVSNILKKRANEIETSRLTYLPLIIILLIYGKIIIIYKQPSCCEIIQDMQFVPISVQKLRYMYMQHLRHSCRYLCSSYATCTYICAEVIILVFVQQLRHLSMQQLRHSRHVCSRPLIESRFIEESRCFCGSFVSSLLQIAMLHAIL